MFKYYWAILGMGYLFIFCPVLEVKSEISTSLGPRSDEEATILWEEGQKSFENKNYEATISYLSRLTDRYPGKVGYFKASLLLGQSYYEMGQYLKAKNTFQGFLLSTQIPLDQAKARILLGKCLIALKQYTEASLIAQELNRQDKTLPFNLKIESLLLQIEAHLGLNQNHQALEVLDFTDKQISSIDDPSIHGKVCFLRLNLKLKLCEQLPTSKIKLESQLRSQMERRHLCLLEGLIIYQKIIKNKDTLAIENATQALIQAFQKYNHVCAHPIKKVPLFDGNKKRTLLEERRYREELTDLILSDCEKKKIEVIEFLNSLEKLGLSLSLIQKLKNSLI